MSTATVHVSNLAVTYRGDRTDADTSALCGPDLHGAYYRPAHATYDAQKDTTRVVFAPASAGDAAAETRRRANDTHTRRRLRRLFSTKGTPA